MYCELIAATGWTWEYIGDHMTLPRLAAMQQYWRSHPPLHTQLEILLGGCGVTFEPQTKKRVTRDSLRSLVSEINGMT